MVNSATGEAASASSSSISAAKGSPRAKLMFHMDPLSALAEAGLGEASVSAVRGNFTFKSGYECAQALLGNGRLRALGVTTAKRSPTRPSTPV